MPWNIMADLATGDTVVEVDMDAIRGNINLLHLPNIVYAENRTDYSTTSTSYVPVGGIFTQTVTTLGGRLEIYVSAVMDQNGYVGGATISYFTLDIGGVQIPEYLIKRELADKNLVTRMYVKEGLSEGSHEVRLLYKCYNASYPARVNGTTQLSQFLLIGY